MSTFFFNDIFVNHKLGSQSELSFRLGWSQSHELVQVTQHDHSCTQWDRDHWREDGFLKEKVAVCQLQRNYKNKFLAENLKG